MAEDDFVSCACDKLLEYLLRLTQHKTRIDTGKSRLTLQTEWQPRVALLLTGPVLLCHLHAPDMGEAHAGTCDGACNLNGSAGIGHGQPGFLRKSTEQGSGLNR